LVTFGEGWHNNHHAQPAAAYHGHRWWEIDATGWVISVCKVLRIATNVKNPKPMTANSQTETVYS
jgi:stearoyl-CoA desaturase (delta-9 desaturase)